MDGSLRTGFLALSAHLALLGIDVGEVVLERNGFELLASLDAFATTNTGSLASLVGNGSFVLVVAKDNDSATFRTFETNFDDASWTSFRASTASRTLLLINFGQTCLWIHLKGVELTL